MGKFLTANVKVWAIDPELPISLYTDAGAFRLDAMLVQRARNREFRLLGFYSHRNTGPESRYKAYELELHAVVSAVELFRYVLLGRGFTPYTNHTALLKKKKIFCSQG